MASHLPRLRSRLMPSSLVRAGGRRPGWAVLGLLWLGLCLLVPVQASAEAPLILETEAQLGSFPTVVLQLAVQDDRQQPVPGLTPDTITIREEGEAIRPMRVAMLKESPTPLNLMIAVDTSLGMADAQRLDEARAGIKQIVGRLRPSDRAALVRFDSTFAVAQPFTSDQAAFGQALDRLLPDGNRRLYDGAYLALAETARLPGNRAVLLLTSGDDTQSEVSLGTLKNLAADTGLKVYVIGVGDVGREDLLESLAKGSGGRYYRAPTPTDQSAVLRAAFEDFTSRYEIVYTTQTLEPPPGGRTIAQVVIDAPGGAATAIIAYRVPQAGSIVPQYGQPLQTVPPRPVAQPLPDEVIVALGTASGLGVLLACLGLTASLWRSHSDRRLRNFVATRTRHEEPDLHPSLASLMTTLFMRLLAEILIRLLPPHQVRLIARRLVLAGHPYNWRVTHFLAVKGMTLLIGLLLGWLIPPPTIVMALTLPLMGAIGGFMAPDVWLNSRIRQRQRDILRALPNALDLLAISVEAGLSLDAAMLEVVHKWRNPLTEEFSTILADLKVGKSRREALRGLSLRTDVSEVTAFVSALIQADEVGLSIGRTLTVQAEQIRVRHRQRAERLAREASIKMLFPLALLIFPAIFVVILVPAMPTLVDALRSLTG